MQTIPSDNISPSPTLATFPSPQLVFEDAYAAIEVALKSHQFAEAIALSETVMSYCLAVRKARLQYQDTSRIKISGLGALVFELTGIKLNGVQETNRNILPLYMKIMDWSEQKNRLLHELMANDNEAPWAARYANLEVMATQGAELVAHLLANQDEDEWPEAEYESCCPIPLPVKISAPDVAST